MEQIHATVLQIDGELYSLFPRSILGVSIPPSTYFLPSLILHVLKNKYNMFVQSFAILFFFLSFVSPFVATHPVERKDLEERAGCTFAMKKAAIQHEIDTISSHSFSDANQIPLAPTASRTFYVT